jgi:hypothetical protein
MRDILDLILEFEKKLLTLIRDLLLAPQRVVDSLIAKDKQYVGSFKFYSIVTSLWIILFHLGNQWFDLFPEEFVLPVRLSDFLKSETDFAFLIAPFIGLAEFFIPMAVVNWLLFRKNDLSLIGHINLNIHLAGLLLLYEVPVFLTGFILLDLVGIADSETFDSIMIFIIIGFPVIFYAWTHIRIFRQRRILSFAKAATSMMLIGYASIVWVIQEGFHENIHRLLLYSSYNQFEVQTNAPGNVSYYLRPYEVGTYSSATLRSISNDRHAAIATTAAGQTSLKLFSPGQSEPTEIELFSARQYYYDALYSVHDIHSGQVVARKPNNSDTTWLRMIGADPTLTKPFLDLVTGNSRFKPGSGGLYFSGFSKRENLPLLGTMTPQLDVASRADLRGFPDFGVDDFSMGEESSVEMLLFHISKLKLREITWLSGKWNDTTITPQRTFPIYKNEFSPTSDVWVAPLHKGRIGRHNDSTSVISFQVMTDTSFVLNVTSLSTVQTKANWSFNYAIPADFAYFDHVLATGKGIYVLGRSVSIFRPEFSYDYLVTPFVLIIDPATGREVTQYFLPIDPEHRTHFITFMEGMYLMTSSAFHDEEKVYWCLDGQHFWEIPL